MENFKPPFRIAPANKLVVQDADRKTVTVFYKGAEELAAEYAAFINKKYKGMLTREDIKKII